MASLTEFSSESQFSGCAFLGQAMDTGDSIRLLEVQPGNPEDLLVARLLFTNLQEAPPYEALSYTWGDAQPRKHIQISQTAERNTAQQIAEPRLVQHVPVTLNCYAALKCLRKHGPFPRTLWVDSMCINQDSFSERKHQLTLMTRIYGGATRAVVFLGESDEGSDEAMDWIRELHAPSDYFDGSQTERRPLNPDTAVLESLFRRSWFHRVWVLQEVQMAQEVVVCCGDSSVDWEAFEHFKTWNTSSKCLKKLPHILGVSTRRSVHLKPAKRLLRELTSTRHCQATDPRDKLYAILPLLWRQYEYEDLKVDYTLSATQVFINLAIYLLKNLGLRVLRLVEPGQISRSALPALPSWVPDWTMPKTYPRPRQLSLGRRGLPDMPPASQTSTKWTVVVEDLSAAGIQRHALRGDGKRVGSICILGDKCDIGNDYFPIRQWESLVPAPELLQTRITNKSRANPFWSLLYGWEDTAKFPEVESRILWYDQTKDGYEKPSVPMVDCLQGISTTAAIRARHMFDVCNGQRLFGTDTNFIGLAPEFAEVGDVVFVWKDEWVPFVLRAVRGEEMEEQRAGEPAIMRLVGDCRVLGVMKGELWEGTSDTEEVILW